jgi:nitroreductase
MSSVQCLDTMRTRRSVPVRDLCAPAPTSDQLQEILRAATRVPDHGKLCPWRLVVLHEHGAVELGALAAQQFAAMHADVTAAQINAEHQRFLRAPLCVAVLSTPVADSKPVWEQELSAGAVCMNMLHAIHALGFGGKWLTEWVAYDPAIIAALGGAAGDKIAGFIYMGSIGTHPQDRPRPALADVVREWS